MLKAISALADLVLQTPHSSKFDGQADREYTAAQVLASVSR